MLAKDTWAEIRAELDLWKAKKKPALFWWRDDDATDANAKLERLLAVAEEFDTPVALSAIPARATPRLAKLVAKSKVAEILVHGLRHENHATRDRTKRELGGEASLDAVLLDAATGLRLARARFGTKCLPVLVPPWNRITARAVPHLPKLGFKGLSTWKPRTQKFAAPGLLQVNAHLDVIDWRHDRILKSEQTIAGLLLRKLRWRREKQSRMEEPLGLLTHHAFWNARKEKLVIGLLDTLKSHAAVRFVKASQAFELDASK
ncbi:MAG: polysaccharide deacetylase [Alphaproteobacteria bacterium]|nr:polysaccharide deacetylase [Alphaproteobacteria bacterium]